MKYLIIILLTLTLIGCESGKKKQPTPFKTTDKKVLIQGCEDLKKRVEEWNEKNPNKQPKVADC